MRPRSKLNNVGILTPQTLAQWVYGHDIVTSRVYKKWALHLYVIYLKSCFRFRRIRSSSR